MLLAGTVVESSNRQIPIPNAHRTVPSLQSGTRLRGIVLPADNEQSQRPQFYITGFPQSSWTDTWSVEVICHDQPGQLALISEALSCKKTQINILACESSLGYMTLVCDMSRYHLKLKTETGKSVAPDRGSGDREDDPNARLQYLEDCLTLMLWESLKFDRHAPLLRVKRLDELRRVGMAAKAKNLNEFSITTNQDGVVVLKEAQWKLLTKNMPVNPSGNLTFMIENDLEERFVRITPLSGDRVIGMELEHDDTPGKVANFTRIMTDKLGVNISASKLYARDAGKRNTWCIVLESLRRDPNQIDELHRMVARMVQQLNEEEDVGATLTEPYSIQKQNRETEKDRKSTSAHPDSAEKLLSASRKTPSESRKSLWLGNNNSG